MDLQALVSHYGYAAVLVGTFLEGETILILGGVAAKLGYLSLPWVIAAAFAGTLAGDQLFFFLGRYQGRDLLARRPRWQGRADRVHALLERHHTLLIIGFRFLYGLRTVTPFILGMSRVPTPRFVALNLLGAALWAAVIGGLGFLFGHGMELVLGDLRHYEKEVLTAVLVMGALTWTAYLLLRRRR